MYKFLSYTFLTVMTVDLLATSVDITITWSSPIFPKLYSNDSSINPFDQPITDNEESWIGSLINIGAMIGPLPYGFISEKWGRKIGLLCIAVPHVISYLMLAFAQNVYLYYIARLLGGVAVGGGYALLPTYVAEVAEDTHRGMLSTTLNMFWTFGNLLPYVIGPYTSILMFNLILTCIPASFLVLFWMIGPETPHYLVCKNRMEEAEQSLMKLRSGDKKAVEAELKQIQSELVQKEKKDQFVDLFKLKVYRKALMISLVLVIGNELSGISAVLVYTQDIFEAAGVTGIDPEIASMIVGLVTFLSSLLTPFFADWTGRRVLMLVSCFGMALAHIIFGVYYYLRESTDVDVSPIWWLPIFSLVFYIIAWNIGMGPLPWTITSEIFPTSVKSYTASLASFTCYATAFLVTKFFNDMNDSMTKAGTFWLFGGFCIFAALFTLFLVPETRGKSFREIQEILEKKWFIIPL